MAEPYRRCLEFLGLCLAAASAAALLLGLFFAPDHIRYPLVGGSLIAVGFAVCGNMRLGLLAAFVFSAQFGVAKKFFITPNMGGASALQVDGCDAFLIPLVLLILRDMQLGFRRPSTFNFPAPARWWLLLTLVGSLTIVFGPFRFVATLEVARMLKLLLIMLVMANEVTRRSQFRIVCGVLIASVIMQSSLAVTQYILQRPIGLQAIGEASAQNVETLSRATLESGEFVFRVGALLGHANLLAAFLSAMLPFAFVLLFTRVPLRLRLASAGALGLGGAALILTLSRTGWIAAAATLSVGMALTLFHPQMRVRFPLGRVGFVVGAVTIAGAFSGKIGARIFGSEGGAVDFRWEMLEVAWKMGSTSPVLGTGLNSFVFQMPPFTRYGSYEGAIAHFGEVIPVVHNVYALYFAETGVLGFVFFCAFCLSVVKIGIRCLRAADEEAYALGTAALLGFIAFMMDWLTSFTLRVDNMSRVIFIVVGLVAALERWRPAEASRPPPPQPQPDDSPHPLSAAPASG